MDVDVFNVPQFRITMSYADNMELGRGTVIRLVSCCCVTDRSVTVNAIGCHRLLSPYL